MSRRPERPAPPCVRRASGVLLAAVLTAALAGCIAEPSPTGTPTARPSMSGSSPEPTATVPAAPQLLPEGTADDNLPLFDQIVSTIWSTPDNVSGRAYVDALVAAGFDKASMQVTHDQTTVGDPAESIQFSVRWGDECLVGQVGPSTGAPVAVVLPGLAEGGCLVGATRPIDW